jgi:hypothetical protein
LLGIGVIAGMIGAVPTFFWATSVFALVLFPFVSFVALWIYSLIFIFSALWFSHFLLNALKQLREKQQSNTIDEPGVLLANQESSTRPGVIDG